jgi:hypothetical protein
MFLGVFLGWIPLLVTGVVYYSHPISGNNPMSPHRRGPDGVQLNSRHWRWQEIPLLQRTTVAGERESSGDDRLRDHLGLHIVH